MVDSSKWEILQVGIRHSPGKPIVNSISLKEGEEEFLKKAKFIHQHGAAVVVMAFDEQGQAADYENKVRICKRAYKLLTENGFPAEDIVFDPNILTVGTGFAGTRQLRCRLHRSRTYDQERVAWRTHQRWR